MRGRAGWRAGLLAALLLSLSACAEPGGDPRMSGDPPPLWLMPPEWHRGLMRLRRHAPPSSERPPWYTDPPAEPERHRLPDDGFWDTLALGGAAPRQGRSRPG